MPGHMRTHRPMLHPLHAILLCFPVAFFTGAVAADITYLNTAEMQWSNFAAWFITGALVMGGGVLAWALALLIWRRSTASTVYAVLVAAMWGAGLVNAFQHSRDAWSSVGATGLTLSILSTLLVLIAAYIGFSTVRGVKP